MKVYTVHEALESAKNKLTEVTAERDALAAQLMLIRNTFRDESLSASETLRKIPFVIDLTLRQRLTELRAQAGRAGFVEGVEWQLDNYNEPTNKIDAADKYADSIRQESEK